MKKVRLLYIIVFVVALVPLGYLGITWNTIPETVPVHYNAQMEPDSYGSKQELILVTGILGVVSILLFLLLDNLHRFDPKRRNRPASRFTRLGAGLVIFMSALAILIILAATQSAKLMENFLFPVMGLLFAFLGNYMVNIKPNYFAGFRLPWTLSDNENWRKTHHLGGKLWFWAGIIFAVLSLFIPSNMVTPIFVGMMVIITLWPAVYSYTLFKRKSEGNT